MALKQSNKLPLIKKDTTFTSEEKESEDTIIDSDTIATITAEIGNPIVNEVAGVKILTDDEVNAILANSPMPMVTKEYIKSRINQIVFTRLAGTTTHCQIILDNNYSTSGESACVNPENYNKEVGEKYSYESAFAKLWPLFGFLLAEKNFLNKKQ